jgi:hypothetical protein
MRRDAICAVPVAWDQQIGLEPTPEEYVRQLVCVFRYVRQLLTEDGTLWLNLGDSYASGGRKTRDPGTQQDPSGLRRRRLSDRPAPE